MGSDAGKKTRVQGMDYVAPNASGLVPTPGKATLAGNERPKSRADAKDVGNAVVEGTAFCQKRPDAPGCELKPEQFSHFLSLYYSRVNSAKSAFGDALEGLRVDELLRKEEDPNPLLKTLMDVMAQVALGGIGSVLGMIKSDPVQSTFGLGLDVQDVVDVLSASNVVDGGRDAIGWIVKQSVEFGKKSLMVPNGSLEKKVTLNYIEYLQNASEVAWEHQREDPPGYATHADLIVLFHSFSATAGFTTPLIKQALSDKIERYKGSSAARIGRHQMRTQQDMDLQGYTTRDTKVAWVPDKRGVPVLYYLKQDASVNGQGRNAEDHNLPLVQPKDRDFVRDKPVELEFVDVAISRHKDIWGKAPETLSPDTGLNANDPRTWITRGL